MNTGILKTKEMIQNCLLWESVLSYIWPDSTHAMIVRHNTHSLYKTLVHTYTTLFHCHTRNLYLFLHGDGSTKGALTLLEFLTNV